MDHVILTRFNLPSAGAESVVRARTGWLADRIELFERYCLPSVLAQTDSRARWIVYFDPASPDWLCERIRRHAEAGHYVPVFRVEVSRDELIADISGLFHTRGDELLTTNLDNDDGLANDFVERLHAQPSPAGTTAYFLTNGLIKGQDGVYRRRDRHNAFPSVRESWAAPVTCWTDWHSRLARRMPVIDVGGRPAWLQVVHGNNVSNRIRGRLVKPGAYQRLFGTLLEDVPEPGFGRLAHDRFVGAPLRVVRDSARSVTKTVAMRALGPAGFERAKHRLAALAARGRGA